MFFGTKAMVELSSPLLFVAIRFTLASIALATLCRRSLIHIGRQEWAATGAIGIPMFIAYWLQAAGLTHIQSGMSAFITAMHVPMVPILQLVFMRLVPHRMTWAGTLICLIGLLLLTGPQALVLSLESGEALTILSTVAIAVEIVMIGVFAPRVNVQAVATLQLACVAVLAWAAIFVRGEEIHISAPPVFWPVTITMAAMIALVQVAMNWAQQTVSPTRATLIYSSEPVWAILIGWLGGERLGGAAVVGCGLILAGVLVSEWRPRARSIATGPAT